MAFSPTDLADDTDFERLVISRLGVARPDLDATVYDLRGQERGDPLNVQRVMHAVMGFGAREELRESLQPLAFGAAYKALDMLIEHVLRANGASGRLTFAHKSATLGTRPATLPVPFDARPDLLDRLSRLYVALQDARHALTHRRAGSAAGGDLRVHDDRGRQTDVVSSSEISDFSAAALSACELVIDTSTDSRRIAELSCHLNRLQHRHGLGALGGASLGDDRRLLRAILQPVGGGRWQMDYEQIRGVIARQPATAIWDIELHADERRMFVARWEDVPGGSEFIEFDATLLPPWLTEEVASAT